MKAIGLKIDYTLTEKYRKKRNKKLFHGYHDRFREELARTLLRARHAQKATEGNISGTFYQSKSALCLVSFSVHVIVSRQRAFIRHARVPVHRPRWQYAYASGVC